VPLSVVQYRLAYPGERRLAAQAEELAHRVLRRAVATEDGRL
jgi:hypothetical protein